MTQICHYSSIINLGEAHMDKSTCFHMRLSPQGRFRRPDSRTCGYASCLVPVALTHLHRHTGGNPQRACLHLCRPAILPHHCAEPGQVCMDTRASAPYCRDFCLQHGPRRRRHGFCKFPDKVPRPYVIGRGKVTVISLSVPERTQAVVAGVPLHFS